jgi:hypothetical protein
MSVTNESYLKVFITAAKKYCVSTRAFHNNVLLTEVCKGNKNLAGWFRAFFRFPHNKRWLEDVCHIILLGKGLFIELKFTELSKIQIWASSEHPGSSGLKNLLDVYVGAVMEIGGRGEEEAEQQRRSRSSTNSSSTSSSTSSSSSGGSRTTMMTTRARTRTRTITRTMTTMTTREEWKSVRLVNGRGSVSPL